MDLVCGLDVGTSGAKALAVDGAGKVFARAETRFAKPPYVPAPGLAEQDAGQWWEASIKCLKEISSQVGEDIIAIAVDSTSGTFVPVDESGNPLIPAFMYNDGRAAGLEEEVNHAARDFSSRLGHSFPAAFSLVKLLWLVRERPDIVRSTYKFLHAADFLVGKLTGNFDSTDTSNGLKSGVDLISRTWPDFIERDLGLPLEKFPKIFSPGEKVGEVTKAASRETGLKTGASAIAGASDGTASFLASGAKAVGDWNFNLGTTLAIRGISKDLIRDLKGRFYCHRHPEGHWLPGGASNAGGEALIHEFGESRLSELDRACIKFLPTELLVYPLIRKGERMPFVSSSAEGFVTGEAGSKEELYAGYLEGISLITTWSIEEARKIGADAAGDFFLSGGGSRGKTLSRLIASGLGKNLVRVLEPDAAMGSVLLAAAWAWYRGSVSAAQTGMVKRDRSFEPIPEMRAPLMEKLEALKKECQKRGYL
ncbi:MAG: hypothetical protein EHM36_07510 [Deltaproteobacteria bacterium]|nr:MAG: hypothetical protein EHM36_07510 [Deltaproteobacteria bacterium]